MADKWVKFVQTGIVSNLTCCKYEEKHQLVVYDKEGGIAAITHYLTLIVRVLKACSRRRSQRDGGISEEKKYHLYSLITTLETI